MKSRFALAILAVCMPSLLGGCNGPAPYITKSPGPARDSGAPGGHPADQANGSATGPDTSVFAGTLVYGSIGRSMDEGDRIKITQALEMSRANHTVRWHNSKTGIEYSVTPVHTYETASGPCRDFTTQALIDGQQQSIRASACRQSNGVWQASP